MRADILRYFKTASRPGSLRILRRVLGKKEIHPVLLFRLGTWIYLEAPRALRPLLKFFWWPCNDWISTLYDVHIEVGAKIGPGFYLGHRGGVWINPMSQLGENCNISQGVVIGAAGSDVRAPVIGDRVWIGPHAVITGPLRVGNDCVIGANTLVVADVPDKAVVVGVPGRILSYSGSARLIRLREE